MKEDRESIAALFDGTLPWPQVHTLISGYKSHDRFALVRDLWQERVGFAERIVLPVSPKLFIVDAGDRGVVKCSCGQELGDWRANWKLSARIRVRQRPDELRELFGPLACDPDWMEIREFICPGCAALLEVEAAVPGYPFTHDFDPDLESFYWEWLGEEPPAWARAEEGAGA